MAAPPATGPVADFCAELRRLARACGVLQKEIAKSLAMSPGAISELLGGRRRKPPDWDVVHGILRLCAVRCGSRREPPPGMRLDEEWWKGRHAELTRTFEAAVPRGHEAPGPNAPADLPRAPWPDTEGALTVAVATRMDVREAVSVLAAGREEAAYSQDQLLDEDPEQPRVLRRLLRKFPERVRAAHGARRAVLVQAARVLLVSVALSRCGARSWGDTRTLVKGGARAYGWPVSHGQPTGPDGPVDPALREGIERTGLSDPDDRLLLDRYLHLARPLAEECPEFGLATGLPAGRDATGTPGPPRPCPRSPACPTAPGTGLTGLGSLLAEFAGQGEGELPPSARALLDEAVAALDVRGPTLPSLADGYVNPRYRLAGPGEEGVQQGAASDKWWEGRPLYADIECFLAAHLLSLPALLSPLLVLGHPGAGKSLLTRLLAARLPAREFRPLRVELRYTPADVDVQAQLEHALRRDTGRDESWPAWAEGEPGVVPVVLLDGFDELLQAGAQRLDSGRQWSYLREIERFQRREAEQDRPLVVVVTSRTVVADRAEIPPSSQVLRLEPFEENEIEQWLTTWNRTNQVYLRRRGLRPLSPDVLAPHQHLAAQPLLLMMLALYDADDNALHRLREEDEDIRRTELYDRLLSAFVRRQLIKDSPLPAHRERAAVEQELHRLSVIAFGMFQRGAQAITGGQADDDLRALAGGTTDDHLLFGRFFFVHDAQAVVTEQRLHSYEFMHATFGEHLAARLVDGALRVLPGRSREGHRLPDDAELYALLSFTPLTDRAQVVQNLADMLAARESAAEREALPGLLAELFREVPWDAGHRSPHAHAPTRQTRAYRDAVYSANLLLIGVLAAGHVHASEFLGADDLIDRWRRHAMTWQAQMSRESWDLYTSTLCPERVWRQDSWPDLRISTGRVPFVQHELSWRLDLKGGATPDESSDNDVPDVVRRVMFVGDGDAELLLNAAHPLLHRLPHALRHHCADDYGHVRSAAHALVALLTSDVYEPTVLPDLYERCMQAAQELPSPETDFFFEAISRQLVHDSAVLSDAALCSILSALSGHLAGRAGTAPTRRALVDCAERVLGRGGEELHNALEEWHGHLAERRFESPRVGVEQFLVELSQAGRSADAWRAFHAPHNAADHLDACLADVDLPAAAARHPSAVIGLLRLAMELGRTDWLAAHTSDLLVLLPDNAFGLLRPSDLGPLRDALGEGGYDYETEFAEVESSFSIPPHTARTHASTQVASDSPSPPASAGS